MSHADPSRWPALWLLGSWLRTWAWVSPCGTRWRTEGPVTSACGALGGVSAPLQAQCCSAGLLAPSSTAGQEVWRGSDSWRSSSGWPAAPPWLPTRRWWQEARECLPVKEIFIITTFYYSHFIASGQMCSFLVWPQSIFCWLLLIQYKKCLFVFIYCNVWHDGDLKKDISAHLTLLHFNMQ